MANLPPGAVERVNKRKQRMKAYSLPDGKEHRVHTTKNCHVPADWVRYQTEGNAYNGNWDDLDTDLEFVNGSWQTKSVYYKVQFAPAEVGFRFQSRGQDTLRIWLRRINGQPFTVPTPTAIGNQIEWRDCIPGVHIKIQCTDMTLIITRIFDTAGADLRWRTWEKLTGEVRFGKECKGFDNGNQLILPDRTVKRKNRVEVDINIHNGPTTNGSGEDVYNYTESLTGRVFGRRISTGEKQFNTDLTFPVEYING